MDRGAWWATVHGVAKSQTLKELKHMICSIFHSIPNYTKNLSLSAVWKPVCWPCFLGWSTQPQSLQQGSCLFSSRSGPLRTAMTSPCPRSLCWHSCHPQGAIMLLEDIYLLNIMYWIWKYSVFVNYHLFALQSCVNYECYESMSVLQMKRSSSLYQECSREGTLCLMLNFSPNSIFLPNNKSFM